MSIRLRLLVMCVVVAILPAIPLTILVQNLLEKSFNVGLNSTVSDALDSGMDVSRRHLVTLLAIFEASVREFTRPFSESSPESSQVDRALKSLNESMEIDGYLRADPAMRSLLNIDPLPVSEALIGYIQQSEFQTLVASNQVKVRDLRQYTDPDLSFYETEDKSVQLALWEPLGLTSILFYGSLDPQFLSDANLILEGNQIFAQLRLAQGTLGRSFFYPFMIVYSVVLAIALLLAMLMAERMSAPVRRLAEASTQVAEGNWQIQLKRDTGGEIGRLIDAFNLMVRRLDSQQRKLLDMEKIAGWREMARHLAHEIKNPLLPIRLAVQEMRDQYRGDDATYREFISDSGRIVDDELEHLNRLVKEFSSFAKMPGLKPTMGSLERLLTDVAKLYPQVDTSIAADSNLPDFPFDADQMRRVLINLFDNAVSVAPDGERPRVSVALTSVDGSASLVFTDNGPGISAENIAKVFDPYFTTRSSGTGLGLALTKSIVVMHEGFIEAASPSSGGATFTVTLPLSGPLTTAAETPTLEEG